MPEEELDILDAAANTWEKLFEQWHDRAQEASTEEEQESCRDLAELYGFRMKKVVALKKSLQKELAYLRYFHGAADFGPADDDVRNMIDEEYEGEMPDGYKEEE